MGSSPIHGITWREAVVGHRLQGDELEDWRITQSALGDGRGLIPQYQGRFGAYAISQFVVDLLLANCNMHSVELGSGESGCVVNAQLDDGRPLYIKLKMEDEMAVILSFHVSKH